MKQIHLADAVEHTDIAETATEVTLTASKMFQMFLKDPKIDAAIKNLTGRPVRVTVKVGEVSGAAAPAAPPRLASNEGEAAERALSHPEVKRFQELFPDSHVRTVRNLKEN